MAYFYTLLMFLLPPGQLKPNIPQSTTEVFKEAVSLQDRIPDIIARYYVISGDHNDFIAKDDVQQYLDADLRAVGIKITPGTVIERLNKMEGVLYKKGKRTSDGRGAFLGLITLEEHYRREDLRQQEEARLQYEADKLQRQKGNPLISLYASKEQWIEMDSRKRKATEEAERLDAAEAERLEAEEDVAEDVGGKGGGGEGGGGEGGGEGGGGEVLTDEAWRAASAQRGRGEAWRVASAQRGRGERLEAEEAERLEAEEAERLDAEEAERLRLEAEEAERLEAE